MTTSLFISYDGLTDPLGQSQIIPYLIGLSKEGYQIHVLSSEKKEAFNKRKDAVYDVLQDYNINWSPTYYHKSPPIFSTLLDIILIKRKAKRLHQMYDYQIVHCRSYIASLIGRWMQKKYKVKFIFDMRGFWPDERVDGKLWNLNNPFYKWVYKYFKRREREFLQESDYIVSLTNNGKDAIVSELGYSVNSPIEVIPCCVDLEIFHRTKTDLSDKNFILSYIGSIGTWYMLEEMLDFFKILKKQIPQSRFLFVTMEPEELIYVKSRERNIDDSSIIVKSAERHDVPGYIAQSSASIFFIKPVFSKRASSPTKQGEIMAMGVPIICNTNVGDTDFVINRYNSGILIQDFNQQSYERAVGKLLSYNFDNDRIEHGAREFYSLEEGVSRYARIYASLLSK